MDYQQIMKSIWYAVKVSACLVIIFLLAMVSIVATNIIVGSMGIKALAFCACVLIFVMIAYMHYYDSPKQTQKRRRSQ